MYLPGIGEAIGGMLRIKHENSLWEQAQGILKDESKPMAERLQMVGVAYPDLVGTGIYKDRLEQARLFDQDKREAEKFKREQRELERQDNFRLALASVPAENRRGFLLGNADLAAMVVPQELEIILKEEDRIKDNETSRELFELEQGRLDERQRRSDEKAASAAAKKAELKLREDYQKGLVNDDGTYKSPEQLQSEKVAQGVQLATATAEATAGVKAEVEGKAAQSQAAEFGKELIDYRNRVVAEGATGGFGADEAALSAQRNILVTKLARQMAGGKAEPNPGVVKAAESMIPGTSILFATPDSFEAAINEVIKAQGVDPVTGKTGFGSQGVTVD